MAGVCDLTWSRDGRRRQYSPGEVPAAPRSPALGSAISGCLGLLAGGVALAAGLLTPYFLAARTENTLLLTISALATFVVLACVGTKLALSLLGK